jgi:magnesium transporter
VLEYGADSVQEREVADPEQLHPAARPGTTVWVDVQGFADTAKLRAIARVFELHPLVLEDATNVPQRAKSEVHAHEHVLVARVPVAAEDGTLEVPQACIILGRGWLLTFQDLRRGIFDPVREAIRQGSGPIRQLGADYLAYALLDAVVDRYFPVVEALATELEDVEAEVAQRPAPDLLARLQRVRRALAAVRRVGWPQREALGELAREPSPFVSNEVRVYLRDVEQHVRQIIELADSSRELAGLVTEIYLSQISHRTNEVMKVLTLVSSIFIPLTFVVGIYGMNFDVMPELHWRFGYPAVLLGMGAIAVCLILWFRRRGWWD